MTLDSAHPCWSCTHCGSVVCPDPASDGVRVTGGPGHVCPLCAVPLQRALLDEREPIEICERCKGTLMARRGFAVTLTARRRAATTPSVTPDPADPRQLDRRVVCPNCAAAMITDWYYGPGNIVIDTCPACDLVWLDAGELRRAADAPGGDRLP
ncbi:MAG TPA: zf-TFIIB domain-containing protein [Vicinamibacterales bacterium]